MFLHIDIIKEIVKQSDIPSIINICKSSKNSEHWCTNTLWIMKFNQFNIPIYKPIPTTFNQWAKLYHLNCKADGYINTFLIHNYAISLQKDLENIQLIYMLNNIINKRVLPLFICRRGNKQHINFDMLTYYEPNRICKYIADIHITEVELKEFIYQLFLQKYLV
jgi:hypothetical protein